MSALCFSNYNILIRNNIEYKITPLDICEKDYGYTNGLMKNTVQSVFRHNKTKILNHVGDSDITHLVNFKLIAKLANKLKLNSSNIVTQRNFLINLGILKRAEIISKKLPFTKKTNIYYRLKRLIDNEQMGELFKVIFLTKNNTFFNKGFESD